MLFNVQKLEGEARVGVSSRLGYGQRGKLVSMLIGMAVTLCLVGGPLVSGAQSLEGPQGVESAQEGIRGGIEGAPQSIPSIFAPETTFVQTAQSAVTAQHLIRNVMSPFCPGLSLEACPSPNAQILRTEIRRSIANGETETAIRESLVKQYGRAVLGIPPDNMFGAVAWAVPWVALLAAGALITVWLRRRVQSAALVASIAGGSVAGSADMVAFPTVGSRSDDAELLKRLNAELAKDDEPQDGER